MMYNPFVPDDVVEAFLKRHCEVVKGGTKLPHSFGCWSGRRRYAVKLKPDPRNPGEVLHLPSFFSIVPVGPALLPGPATVLLQVRLGWPWKGELPWALVPLLRCQRPCGGWV